MSGARRLSLFVGVLTAVTLGSCSLTDGVVDGTRPTRIAEFTANTCPRSGAELPRRDELDRLVTDGRLPEGFTPTRALRCVKISTPGDWQLRPARRQVEIQETRTTVVSQDFLGSLELPDQVIVPNSHVACPGSLAFPSWIVLIDARGRAVIPHLPQGPCAGPRAEVFRAIDGLGFGHEVVHRFEANTR